MPTTIRVQVDRVSADLAAEELRQEGVPTQVVSDSDMLGGTGVPMAFSLVVLTQFEERARRSAGTALDTPTGGRWTSTSRALWRLSRGSPRMRAR